MANENGTTHDDVAKLKESIKGIEFKLRMKLGDLCKYYAGKALKNFQDKQVHNAFWQNQTGNLFGNADSGEWITKEFSGFYLYLKEHYGVYVELANDRKHEAIRPTVMALYSDFMRDVEKIYAD
jgi:hypothetical protein